MKKILIIDDDRSIARTIELLLGDSMKVLTAQSAREGLSLFERESPPVAVLDIRLPDMSGLEVLRRLKAIDPAACVIIITAFQDMETTIEAIKNGAFDYIPKPVNTNEFELSVQRAFQTLDLHKRLQSLEDEVYADYRANAIVGKTRCMEEIFKTIGIASQSKVTTLIQGESGTGKELVARAIHFNSDQRKAPFVAINCSALVETLLESELFGHEKGSFTGALYRKEGKFEAASGGTVFLDEIGEMSHALQVKLLRVLQDKTFERVGGTETIRADVRVIAATNKDLKALVDKGLFRDDLYYRLKVVTIDMPPLRARKEDIPILTSHLLAKANKELHRDISKVPEDVMARLVDYPWPGNVRELENVITRAVLLAKGDVLLDVFLPSTDAQGAHASKIENNRPASLNDVEREHIAGVLDHAGWNKSRASAILGVSLPRLMRKIRKYRLDKAGD